MSRDTPSTPSDKVIVVMGPVGVGKTTFIDSATAQQFQGVDLGLQSRADRIVTREPVSRNGQRYVFVETPGFDGEDSSDIEVLSMIAEYMVKARKEKYDLESILYLHRISDNRLAGPPLRNLELFSAICGTKAMPRMVLVTTMWNHVIKEVGEERERQLKTSFWQDMVNQGCGVKQFDGTNNGAWEIIESSRSSTSTAPSFDVLISEELLDQHKDLKETQAGATLHKHLEQLVKDQNEVNRRLKALAGDRSNRLGTEEERKQVGVLGNTTVQTTEHMQMPKPLSATGVLDDRSKGVKETEVEAILNQQPRRMTRGQGQISGGLSVADNQSPAYNSSPTAESNAADQLIMYVNLNAERICTQLYD
ncbi:hypothetical protein CPB86DRAFT_845922 [Serendipita vermifera]|nr:hypothetical protein CPB86DRAFT_845922 [Serendipita vermifera]